ncbi:TetR/AcrR family transcriptional regulator [Methylobacterium oxalidis]|uniref:TetR family transcriptional regulator n=1 Tax=Methylobacterium oxalidis TaxID=944322 RepID=A0A512J1T3_9HYPH|nr:TetR/AcrR family transcriptional regulator [Methylobacterium oxalidis]GEP03920.1 TetR family transcriptional regulator [Methylobacterium oxalidis]GJE31204.1 HTH-type transcriptional regulator BetI [Methylobacterium oxalidis]GLS65221.1 TetR family transcriptional regulator [Methylobacterium oxalidis]
MSAAVGTVLDARGNPAARREHILDAAETCFVRNGFHRTTMQDLAREAAMSPGNFYRYFQSKEALVLGLAERERQRGMALVEELEQAGDRRGALIGIIERYFLALSCETAILRLDIWSEATRNPDIAAMVARGEAEARAWFVETLAALATAPGCDPVALYEAMHPLMKGIVVGRALTPDYDPAPAVAHLLALIESGLHGSRPDADGTPDR